MATTNNQQLMMIYKLELFIFMTGKKLIYTNKYL